MKTTIKTWLIVIGFFSAATAFSVIAHSVII